MNEFVAIDFETANEGRDSACEIALVRFQDGVPKDRFTSLVFQDRFSDFNVGVHGISQELVLAAPSLKDIWKDARKFIGNSPLVAHNAGFDMSVLFRSLKGEPVGQEIDYFCSMVLSRQILKLAYFGLPGVASHLNIDYPMEHRAESDAVAAGKVAHALVELQEVKDLYELAKKLDVSKGRLNDSGPSGSSHKTNNFQSSLSKVEKQKIIDEIGLANFFEDPDFAGKKIVFTGTLLSMTRKEAEAAVMRAGGITVSGVSSKTNMIIFGWQDPSVLRGKPLSSKRLKAEELRASGVDIEVIDEVQFLEMLADPDGVR